MLMCFAKYTDKLQPLGLSLNKLLKDETKQHFQAEYAEEVQKEIASGTAIPDVKIDTRTSILKPKSANWLIGALDSLSQSLKLSSVVSERPALLMHLKLMDSRTFVVSRPSMHAR